MQRMAPVRAQKMKDSPGDTHATDKQGEAPTDIPAQPGVITIPVNMPTGGTVTMFHRIGDEPRGSAESFAAKYSITLDSVMLQQLVDGIQLRVREYELEVEYKHTLL